MFRFVLLIICVVVSPVLAFSCKTWDDVQSPFNVIGTALSQLEQGGSDALSTAVGGNIDRILRGAEAVFSCSVQLLAPAVSVVERVITHNDTWCSSAFLSSSMVVNHTVDVVHDPCCNATVRTDQCCVDRPYSYRTKGVQVTPQVQGSGTSIGLRCGSRDLAVFLLSQFDRFFELSLDGQCDESYVPVVDDKVSALRFCFENAYRPDLTCTRNEDCMSGLCYQNLCVPEPGRAPLLLLQCLLDNLDEETRPLLRLQLGLTVSSLDIDLESAFVNYVASWMCEDVSNPLNPFSDSRYSGSIVSASSYASCETSIAPTVCEDGGPVNGCASRSVCAYDWPAPDPAILSVTTFSIIVNDTVCSSGVLCSNPGIAGDKCTSTKACNVPCYGSVCASEDACKATGSCSDSQVVWSGGFCVEPFSTSPFSGDAVCGIDYERTPEGCVSATSVVSYSGCAAIGGRWVVPSGSNQDACSNFQFCESGSEVDPVWKWSMGVWDKGTISLPVTRRKAKALVPRRWFMRVDWTRLRMLLLAVFTQRDALKVGSALRCRLVPALTILKFGLCDCANLVGHPTSCWDFNSPLVLGVRSVAKGTAGTTLTTVGNITWFLSSCTDDKVPCVLEYGILLRPPLSLGTGRSSGVYESVYTSSKSSTVAGQALSDLLYVGLSSTLRNGVEVCIQPEVTPDAGNCTTCYPAFGYAADATSRLAVLGSTQVTLRDGMFCGFVYSPGYFVATVARLSSAMLLGPLRLFLVGILFACFVVMC